MAENNMLEPIFNIFWNAGKLLYNGLFGQEYQFNFNDFFKQVELKNKQNVYPEVYKRYKNDLGYEVLVKLPTGLELDNFLKLKNQLEQQILRKVEISFKNGFIAIQVLEKELEKNYKYEIPTKIEDFIKIPIGVSLYGTEYINLKEVPNTLITGTTGSGKSVCSKGILTSLVNMYSEKELELYLIDFKQVELANFRNLKHTKTFVRTVEDAKEVIATLTTECKSRYEEFFKYGLTSIYEYNKRFPKKKMKYQIVFIEEFIMLQEDASKIAMKMLREFASLCRASGQFIFITCQRADNTVIDSVLKANVGNRIVFRMEDSKNSTIALDSAGAELLEGKGHGILKIGAKKTEFRSYNITSSEVKKHTRELIKRGSKAMEGGKEYKTIPKENKTLKNDLNRSEEIDLSFLDKL